MTQFTCTQVKKCKIPVAMIVAINLSLFRAAAAGTALKS